MKRFVRALTENESETSPDADDPSLRGRTYAIPFGRVWSRALALASRPSRWEVTSADDDEGVIEATATTLVFRFVDDVTIRVRLDANAQTRVDMTSRSRKGKADLGTNRRRIARFLRKLDEALDAAPAQVLDPRSSLEPVATSSLSRSPPEGDGPPGGGSDPPPPTGQ